MTNDNSVDQLNHVRAFIRKLAKRVWGCEDIGGYDLQTLMTKHGILICINEHEPCGENCFCLQEYGENAFPLLCYKLAPQWL